MFACLDERIAQFCRDVSSAWHKYAYRLDWYELVPRSLDQCIAQFRRDACSAWRKCAYASSQYFCFVVVGNVGDFRKLQHGWL